jgi:2-phosphoglycerate kinase
MNTLICSSKAPTELRRLPNYSLDKNKKKEINIGIKIKMNHTHSEILNYISRNFSSIFQDPDIGLL